MTAAIAAGPRAVYGASRWTETGKLIPCRCVPTESRGPDESRPIDQIAPGGAALEVHPRLTVLRGASPELRRRLLGTIRSLCGDGDLDESGVIEVSGVQLALDRPDDRPAARSTQGSIPFLADSGPGAGGAASTVRRRASADLPPPVEVVSSDEAAAAQTSCAT